MVLSLGDKGDKREHKGIIIFTMYSQISLQCIPGIVRECFGTVCVVGDTFRSLQSQNTPGLPPPLCNIEQT